MKGHLFFADLFLWDHIQVVRALLNQGRWNKNLQLSEACCRSLFSHGIIQQQVEFVGILLVS